MSNVHKRITRERATVEAMARIYCSAHHGSRKQLCPECEEFLRYADLRLEKCPFQENKPTCANCSTHCYRPDMRERIRTVMRYSGPRMLWRHPVLALLHLADGRRRTPERAARQKSG